MLLCCIPQFVFDSFVCECGFGSGCHFHNSISIHLDGKSILESFWTIEYKILLPSIPSCKTSPEKKEDFIARKGSYCNYNNLFYSLSISKTFPRQMTNNDWMDFPPCCFLLLIHMIEISIAFEAIVNFHFNSISILIQINTPKHDTSNSKH